MLGRDNAIHMPIPFRRFHAVMIWNSSFFLSFRERVEPMAGYNIVGGESNLNKKAAKKFPVSLRLSQWNGVEWIRLDSHPLISYIGTKG